MTPTQDSSPRSAGRILVDQLLIHGATCGYCVPGESYLEVLDALHDVSDRFTLINARHEAGAANMAEAHGKLTGAPGIAFVTRGPGACHAAIGVHIARQDSTPMILLVGQVGRDMMDREAFQEIDYRAMFGSVAKWAAQIDDAARIPEYMARAFRVATSGRPGPVVLALPEDMLAEERTVADSPPYRPALPELGEDGAARIGTLLHGAERPLLIVGGGGWSDAASADITRFAELAGLPAICSFRRQDIIGAESGSYAGDLGTASDPALTARIAEADLLLVVGARLGEMTTKGYSAISAPTPAQKIIHLHPDADELGRVYAPALGCVAAPGPAAARLARLAGESWPAGRWRDRWRVWRRALRDAWLADTAAPAREAHALDLSMVMDAFRQILPKDAIITLDAGNHGGWAQRFLRYGRPGRQLGSTCGAMGYSVPAGVAASIAEPGRVVLSFVGDGGFMMSGAEIATAAQHGGRPIVVVINNASYGTIRMHQEKAHPGRVVGTDLVNPDFVAMARAMGAHAERVETTAQAGPALRRAIACGAPAVIELVVEAEQISSRTTLSRLRGG
ncbi:thiamine pyrophosphate-dependent enzyme [Profundibacterium mesophilum]|uniref:Acetolactate synthase large subunit n=1 Tax=Profundibacterium mesophilum KAUST100406-0324 TaxID=1037889 RepID=A0A921NT03_9RHOB|nr:thiamine pyrophosphate-dependent enzyme [Profundibacterium mesophilum]KAF0676024.1 Acetolactate synthase large subunit [Profundibacterium mesophilum KAUST100406-0324]